MAETEHALGRRRENQTHSCCEGSSEGRHPPLCSRCLKEHSQGPTVYQGTRGWEASRVTWVSGRQIWVWITTHWLGDH